MVGSLSRVKRPYSTAVLKVDLKDDPEFASKDLHPRATLPVLDRSLRTIQGRVATE